MANITVTATPVDVNVSTTLSNIVVTDVETNQTVNVTTSVSNVSVNSTPVNVTISPSIGVSNAEIRAALSNTAPITYDNTTGVIGFDATGTALTAQSLTSLANITAGDGLTVTNNTTLSGDVVIGGTLTLGEFNGSLKDISLSYYDAGDVSGNVTLDVANGIVQKIRLIGDLTGLSFTGIANSTPITLIIQQDNVGFWTIDTDTYPSNWTDYKFVNNFKTLTTTADAYDLASISYDGTNYYTSVVNFVQTLITNGELANSNVIVNGVTISLGGQGNVTTGNIAESGSNLYYTNARSRAALSAITSISGLGALTYNQTTGVFDFTPVTVNDIRSQMSATSPILYNNGTGVISLSSTANISTTGNISGGYILGNGSLLTGVTTTSNAQVVSYIATQPLTVGGNLTVNGNINATGNINVQNVEDLYVRDQTIVMNANAASPANVQIVSNRPGFANTELKWDEQTDRWTFTNDGSTYYNLATSTTDVAEGTNLYYTSDRANTAIGAYQGDINTAGTITAATANATTVNATDVWASNNVYALGALHSPDGSNIQYVRAYSAEYIIESTATSLPLLMEAESNNRISKGDTSLRYVPATKTLFVSEGTIGTNTNNVAGNNFTISGTTTSFGNISTTGNVQGNYFIGNGSQLTGIVSDVQSVNGQTGVVVLDTDDINEGSANLYYSNARVNAFIQDNITTSDIDEGTNLYFTTARVDDHLNTATANTNQVLSWTGSDYDWVDQTGGGSGTVTQIDTGENLTGGPITTTGTIGMANALANVNSITPEASTNFTINSNDKLVLTEQIKGVTTYTGNINGDGYAIFRGLGSQAPFLSHSGSGNLDTFKFVTAEVTAGSPVISNVTIVDMLGSSANISSITQYYAFSLAFGQADSTPFPPATYVESVDVANSTITMSQNSSLTDNTLLPNGVVYPGAYDSSTGLLLGFITLNDATGGAVPNRTAIAGIQIFKSGAYGYPITGPVPNDFVYSVDTASDYASAASITNRMIGRTNIVAPRTVFSAPRGMVVGNGDLTNRAENDTLPSFGINILWDGLSNTTTEYSSNPPVTQLLIKNYTDNNLQNSIRVNAGPRLFFTAAEGNKDQAYVETYPRENLELGRITWWNATQTSAAPSSTVPPSWISGVTGQDCIDYNSGVGMYFANSPDINSDDRGLYFANTKGNTLVTGGPFASSKIRLAAMNTTPASGNSVQMYENSLSNIFVEVGFANTSSGSGSEITLTNGTRATTGVVGDLVLAFDRNDNASNSSLGVSKWATGNTTNFIGLTSGIASNAIVMIYTSGIANPLVDGQAVTITDATGDPANSNVNGNVFYVDYRGTTGSDNWYVLYNDSALTSIKTYDVAWTGTVISPPGLEIETGTWGGTFEYQVASDVTTKNWSVSLEEQSEDLKFKANGTTVATITDAGNISATTFIGNVSGTTGDFTANITANTAVLDKIAISNTGVATANQPGEIVWNPVYGGLDVAMNGINLEIGQQQIFYGKLTENVSRGNVIMFAGAQGDHFLLAKANVDAPGFKDEYIIGLAAEDGVTNDFIYVNTYGRIDEYATGTFTEGDLLYLDVNVPGGLANVAPTAPDHAILVAAVGKASSTPSSTNGIIFVRPTFGKSHLDELHDVNITSPSENQILTYDNGNSVWINENLGSAVTDANVKLKQFAETVVALGNVSGDISSNIDVANGTIYTMTATGNITIDSLANAVAGTSATLIITQSTGAEALSSTMKFAGASKTLSTSASAIDIISVFYDGTTYYATLSKGYA